MGDIGGAGGTSRVLATQTAVFDAGTDDGEVGLADIMTELFEHVGLHHGVLIEGDDPVTAEFLGLAENLVEGGGDAEVVGILYQDGVAGKGADVGDIGRAVVDNDQGLCAGVRPLCRVRDVSVCASPQCNVGSGDVLAQALKVGLIGHDADGVFHVNGLFGKDFLEGLEDARLIDLVLEIHGIGAEEQDAAQDPEDGGIGDEEDGDANQQIGDGP